MTYTLEVKLFLGVLTEILLDKEITGQIYYRPAIHAKRSEVR